MQKKCHKVFIVVLILLSHLSCKQQIESSETLTEFRPPVVKSTYRGAIDNAKRETYKDQFWAQAARATAPQVAINFNLVIVQFGSYQNPYTITLADVLSFSFDKEQELIRTGNATDSALKKMRKEALEHLIWGGRLFQYSKEFVKVGRIEGKARKIIQKARDLDGRYDYTEWVKFDKNLDNYMPSLMNIIPGELDFQIKGSHYDRPYFVKELVHFISTYLMLDQRTYVSEAEKNRYVNKKLKNVDLVLFGDTVKAIFRQKATNEAISKNFESIPRFLESVNFSNFRETRINVDAIYKWLPKALFTFPIPHLPGEKKQPKIIAAKTANKRCKDIEIPTRENIFIKTARGGFNKFTCEDHQSRYQNSDKIVSYIVPYLIHYASNSEHLNPRKANQSAVSQRELNQLIIFLENFQVNPIKMDKILKEALRYGKATGVEKNSLADLEQAMDHIFDLTAQANTIKREQNKICWWVYGIDIEETLSRAWPESTILKRGAQLSNFLGRSQRAIDHIESIQNSLELFSIVQCGSRKN